MTSVSPIKSTNVRLQAPPLLSHSVRLLYRISPALARRWAELLFFTPPRKRISGRARDLLASGESFVLRVRGGRVGGWRWGAGPAVYLVHGWGGRASSLGAFVEPLTRRGFSVVTFDAPGHGTSAGRTSTLLHFAGTLEAAVREVAPAQAVIAHSLGAAATAFALRNGVETERAVFLGAASDPFRFLPVFMRAVGLPEAEWHLVERRIVERVGVSSRELSVPGYAPRMTVPLLAFHDRDDPEVPWRDGVSIVEAWPGARLVTTRGLGHREILRDPEVVRAAVDFVADSVIAEGAAD